MSQRQPIKATANQDLRKKHVENIETANPLQKDTKMKLRKLTIVPQYGRSYKDKAAALEGFHAQHEFVVSDDDMGRVTVDKFTLGNMGIDRVKIQYTSSRQTVVKLP